MRKRGDIREQHPEKKSTISYSMDVEVSEILENDLPSESTRKRTKYGNSIDRFHQSSASSYAAATSKRAAVPSAVQSFKGSSHSASHAQGRLAEASAVVLSASIGTPGFNGSQECKLKKADAITAVGSIIKGDYSPFELVDAVEFHRFGKTSLKMPSWLKGFESQWGISLIYWPSRSEHWIWFLLYLLFFDEKRFVAQWRPDLRHY
jgi:hypothetical protein